jgi:putative flippase GtrA
MRTVFPFLIGGGIATATHWGLMAALVAGGINDIVATTIGAFAGATVNYVLQHRYTFASTREHRDAVPAYVFVTILSLYLNGFTYRTLSHIVGMPMATSQVCTTALLAAINYLLYRTKVFNV